MNASRLTWLVALFGALWTWLLASWSGISLATSLLRAATVFVMLAGVMIVFQLVLPTTRSSASPSEDRPAPAESSVEETSPEQEVEQPQAA